MGEHFTHTDPLGPGIPVSACRIRANKAVFSMQSPLLSLLPGAGATSVTGP